MRAQTRPPLDCGDIYLLQSTVCRSRYAYWSSGLSDGSIELLLPAARPGSRVSARIWVTPKSTAQPLAAKQREDLGTVILGWGGNRTVASDGVLSWIVPFELPDQEITPQGYRMQVHDRPEGRSVDGDVRPTASAAPLRPLQSFSNGEFRTAPFQFVGSPIEIIGSFNGDLRKTKVTVGGQEAEILAESESGLIFMAPSSTSGRQELMVTEGDTTARAAVVFLNEEMSGTLHSSWKIMLFGLRDFGSAPRLLTYTCGTYGIVWKVLNGERVGRFPQCAKGGERRAFALDMLPRDSGSDEGRIVEVTYKEKLRKGLRSAVGIGADNQAFFAFDVQPNFDSTLDAKMIRSSIEAWENDVGTEISASVADEVAHEFEQAMPRIRETAEGYDGVFARAQDCLNAIIRLYLYELRRRSSGSESTFAWGPALRFQSPGAGRISIITRISYSVRNFLTDLSDKYRLNFGWLEITSTPADMSVRENGKLLTETNDEISFTPGTHSIVVEGFNLRCTWTIAVIAGLPTQPYDCTAKISQPKTP